MHHIIIDISIPTEEWLKIYRGTAKTVSATSRDGRSIQFPASILQKFVTHSGVHGSFAIYFNENGKFSSINRL